MGSSVDLKEYRESSREIARSSDLLRLVPKNRSTVLDIGVRDGYFSIKLAEYFNNVTALDLSKPSIRHPRITNVAGDVTRLEFPDSSFDCVFCAEVLEHIPDVEKACREILRVARHEVVIGVPYRQDIRLSRTTCMECGRANPPWGHVNTFDEERLLKLFDGARLRTKSFVEVNRAATNALSTVLMDWGGNPWGSYGQEEPCIHCGAELRRPVNRSLFARVCSAVALRLTHLQAPFVKPHANWIHVVLEK